MAEDRTEKATPKRREDARRKGQIARRPELAVAAAFLAGLAVLEATSDAFLSRASSLMLNSIKLLEKPEPFTVNTVHSLLIESSGHLLLLVLPVMAALIITSLAGNFAQGGFTLSTEALTPNADRFNPANNWKRVFSLDRIVELFKQMLVLVGIALVCYGVFHRTITEGATLVGLTAPQTLSTTAALLGQLGWRAGSVLLLLAAADYAYGWYKHEKSLRMTKQEIKDEYRQQEGDPMMKSQRRRAARAYALRQVAQEVPKADVVVTNPTHFAVALKYDRDTQDAPIVVAKGADFMAQRIREIAKEHDVPVIENPPLARALYHQVETQGVIPPELFRAVAELLAFVYRQRERGGSSQ